MDIAGFISLLEQKDVGIKIEMHGERIAEIRPNGKDVDIEIHNLEEFKSLMGGLKNWKG